MNLKELKELIALIQGTDINELEIERAGIRVRIKMGKNLSQEALEVEKEKAPLLKTKEIKKVDEEGLITISSPMVGTFYRAPSPEAKPFVEEGDSIKKGQVICIIEAMKLMNEIESEVDGKVVKVLVENGRPVEYGEPLFLVGPS